MLNYVGEKENGKRKEYEEDLESDTDYDKLLSQISWRDRILLNRPLKVVMFSLIVAVVAPPIVYNFLFIVYPGIPTDGYSMGTCAVAESKRIPCALDNISVEECSLRCCYDYGDRRCYHRDPSRYSYVNNHYESDSILVPRQVQSPYAGSLNIQRLRMRINEITPDQVNIIIYDESVHQYSEPESVLPYKNYRYEILKPEFGITVHATDGRHNKAVFTASRGPLIALQNLWEWSVTLSDSFIYGFDELPLLGGSAKVIYNTSNNKTMLPIIYGHAEGTFHALLIEHAGPLEMTVLESKRILIKSLVGQSLSMHIFMGPEPREVARQIMEHTGQGQQLKYWALGVHFCRSNMTNSIEEAIQLEETFRREMTAADIPYESDCIDADIVSMMNLEETEEDMVQIQEAVTKIRSDSKSYIASVVPYLLANENNTIYREALLSNLLIMKPEETSKQDNEKPYVGIVENAEVVYLDYYNENITNFLQNNFKFVDLDDGFYLRNNWPLDHRQRDEEENFVQFPYFTHEIQTAFQSSIPWKSQHLGISYGSKLHIANHNFYGKIHTDIVSSIVDNENRTKVPLIFTSNTYIGGKGIYAWQNVTSSWTMLKKAMISAAYGSLTGMVEAIPVCGDSEHFNRATQQHLCVKWYLASMFLPVFRVHCSTVRRDPLSFTGLVRNAMIRAINTRYKLLPYFYGATANSEPLLRPIFYEFFDDERLLSVDEQFMVGKALMIAPNFLPNQVSLNVALPHNETWYEFWDGRRIETNESLIAITTTENDLPAFIRGGYAIPMHETLHGTAENTRKNSRYMIIVALACFETECRAAGNICITNSESIDIAATASNVTFTLTTTSDARATCEGDISRVVNSLKVYGLGDSLNNFDFFYHKGDLNADLCANDTITINYF